MVARETDTDLVEALDRVHAQICSAERDLLALIARAEDAEIWRQDGARDLAHWLSMRYGITHWKARRWIGAARALERLPKLSDAFRSGDLGIDKVAELCRFATSQAESRLISWAQNVSAASIRHRGDLAVKASTDEVLEAERARTLNWFPLDDGRRIGLEAELPTAQGMVVVRAIERISQRIPVMPDEGEGSAEAHRADALVAICSAHIGAAPDPDRATVLIHAQATSSGRLGSFEIDGGPALHREAGERMLCTARIQTVLEDRAGEVLGLGRMKREPSAWMMRQIRYRDRGCRFPGCGTRAFTQAHHITWWSRGGRTDLDNLVLVCSFHHRLVHEYGWSIERRADGEVRWFRPQGIRYRAGPSPGVQLDEPPRLAAVG